MKTDKNNLTENAADHVAALISKRIIYCQNVIAGKLNSLVNQYSPARKKLFLFLFGFLIAALISVNLIHENNSLTKRNDGKQYRIKHIGQASDLITP